MTLSIRNVTYAPGGRTVLSNFSLEVKEGEFLVLLGHNGSGKSSLIRLINGLAKPEEGEIDLCGRSLMGLSIQQRAQRVVTLSQEPERATFGELTVEENATIAKRRVPDRFLGRLREPVGHLSGGERQLLALAFALEACPALLLLDEHTSALDPKVAADVMEQTAASVKGQRVTAVMATHNLEDAIAYGDRLLLVRGGQIVLDLCGEEKRQLSRTQLFNHY